MFKSSPEHAAIVDSLIEVLNALPVGETYSYDGLTQIAGVDIRQQGFRPLLMQARRKAEEDNRCVFSAVKGYGIKRLSAEQSVDIGRVVVKSIRRRTKLTATRLDRISSNSMPQSARQRAVAYSSMLRTIAMMADGNKIKIMAAIVDPAKPIPPRDILKMFTDEGTA